MPKGMQAIYTVNVFATSPSVTFNNIPQTFTDLRVMVSGRSSSSNAVYYDIANYVSFNSDSGNNYSSLRLYGLGSGGGLGTDIRSNVIDAMFGVLASTEVTANTFSAITVDIPEYRSNKNKTIVSDSMVENGINACVQQFTAGTHRSSAPITSMAITGNFVANSTITLYGISR